MPRSASVRKEKAVSWALFHPSNEPELKELLKTITRESIENFSTVCREVPLLTEVKNNPFTVSGYATGWSLYRTDLIAIGEIDEKTAVFVIEVKRRMKKKAYKQVMKYVSGLIVTANREAHNERGEFYRWLLEKVFDYQARSEAIDKLSNEKGSLRIVPVILHEEEKGKRSIEKGKRYRFTEGLESLLRKKEIEIDEPESARIKNSYEMKRKLAESRVEHLKKIYPEWSELHRELEEAIRKNKIPRFTTTNENETSLRLYPSGQAELEGESNAKRLNVGELGGPLGILERLDNSEEGRYYLQVFLSGLNNPTLYLETSDEIFIGFQLRDPFQINCDGGFNRYIAEDAHPLKETPEAGDVLSPTHGSFEIKEIEGFEGLARKIKLKDERNFKAELKIVSPKVRQARSDNLARPFLTRDEALSALSQTSENQNDLFDYTDQESIFVSAGPQLKP